jgi:osmotically inducible lipoprotein OsmB
MTTKEDKVRLKTVRSGVLIVVLFIGCASPSESGLTRGEQGALGGSVIGTGIGAAVGSGSGNTGAGAVIGGASGAVVGAVIGSSTGGPSERPKAERQFLERQKKELDRQDRDLQDLQRQEYQDKRLRRALGEEPVEEVPLDSSRSFDRTPYPQENVHDEELSEGVIREELPQRSER